MSKKNNGEDEGIILNTGVLVFNLMLLNVMWWICCIPVVTIGASTTALNYTCIKMRNQEDDSIVRLFFKSFSSNFKQALFLGTGMVAIIIVLFACLIQALGYAVAGSTLGTLCSVGVVLLLFIWLLVFTFMFFVLSRFDNTIFRTITNSIFFMIKGKMRTLKIMSILVFFLMFIPLFFWEFMPYLVPMCIFIGIPLTAYLLSKEFNKLFEAYIK